MTAAKLNSSDGDPVAVRSVDTTCQMVVDGRRAARVIVGWARRFELSEPEFLVLWCLCNSPPEGIDQTTIAELLALSPAQVSATVERLRAQGCIVREAVPGDRRRHLWRLSTPGRTLITTMHRDAQCRPGQEAAA